MNKANSLNNSTLNISWDTYIISVALYVSKSCRWIDHLLNMIAFLPNRIGCTNSSALGAVSTSGAAGRNKIKMNFFFSLNWFNGFSTLPSRNFVLFMKVSQVALENNISVVFLMEGAQILERKHHEEDNLGNDDVYLNLIANICSPLHRMPHFLIAGLPGGQKKWIVHPKLILMLLQSHTSDLFHNVDWRCWISKETAALQNRVWSLLSKAILRKTSETSFMSKPSMRSQLSLLSNRGATFKQLKPLAVMCGYVWPSLCVSEYFCTAH